MINDTTAADPLAALRRQPETADKSGSKNDVSQTDFIELMVAQLKNQDPTKPLDPNQFMSQLAQFSTVKGIQALQKTVEELATRLTSDQSMKAATLVGHQVLAPGRHGTLVEGEGLAGRVNLEGSVTDLNLKILAPSGALVRTLPMGGQPAGPVDFRWDGFADDGTPMPPGPYQVVAEVEQGGERRQVPVAYRIPVTSVDLDPNGGALTLNLADGSSVPLSEVRQIY